MLSFLLTNGTFNTEYSVGDFTFGYEHQIEQEHQVGKDVHKKVVKLSRKASNHQKSIKKGANWSAPFCICFRNLPWEQQNWN